MLVSFLKNIRSSVSLPRKVTAYSVINNELTARVVDTFKFGPSFVNYDVAHSMERGDMSKVKTTIFGLNPDDASALANDIKDDASIQNFNND